MGWRVSSGDGGRWVEHDGTGWTADAASEDEMEGGAGKPVSLGAGLGVYRPASKRDPVGVYLLARYVIPDPVMIEGTPPAVPEDAADYPADAVF